jgi:hypothetical protein
MQHMDGTESASHHIIIYAVTYLLSAFIFTIPLELEIASFKHQRAPAIVDLYMKGIEAGRDMLAADAESIVNAINIRSKYIRNCCVDPAFLRWFCRNVNIQVC